MLRYAATLPKIIPALSNATLSTSAALNVHLDDKWAQNEFIKQFNLVEKYGTASYPISVFRKPIMQYRVDRVRAEILAQHPNKNLDVRMFYVQDTADTIELVKKAWQNYKDGHQQKYFEHMAKIFISGLFGIGMGMGLYTMYLDLKARPDAFWMSMLVLSTFIGIGAGVSMFGRSCKDMQHSITQATLLKNLLKDFDTIVGSGKFITPNRIVSTEFSQELVATQNKYIAIEMDLEHQINERHRNSSSE